MGLIEVNGIRVFAYHGCLDEEARIGGHYLVDVHVEGSLPRLSAPMTLTARWIMVGWWPLCMSRWPNAAS